MITTAWEPSGWHWLPSVRKEVAGKSARELSDDDVVVVLTSEVKRRKEAAAAYRDAGRPELADREMAEADVPARYLRRR